MQKLIWMIVFSLAAFSMATAQILNVQVKVQMDRLDFREKDDLGDLEQRIADYCNTQQWSDQNQDIVLECNLQIIIETVTNRGSEKVYKAQFLVSSPSGENYYDKLCEFTYYPGQSFEYLRTSFDPLLSLVDYYMYLILGGELDTYELFSGSSFYDKAQDIAHQGQLSNYQLGWKRRLEDVLENTDADHVQLREAKFYYYEGLYFVEKEHNPEYVRKFAKGVVDRLAALHQKRPNSKVLKRFLDSHYQELPKLIQFDETDENRNKLVRIDSRHRDTYLNTELEP